MKNYTKLYQEEYGSLLSLAYEKTGCWEESFNIVQDSFEKMIRHDYDPKKEILVRIIINDCNTHYHKQKRERKSDRFYDIPVSPMVWEKEAEVVKTLLLERITKEIDKLPAKCRNIIKLKTIEGKSNKEIAKLFKLNEVTVRNQLTRARKLLRRKLNK